MTAANIWQGDLVRLRAVEAEDWEKFFDWDTGPDMGFARQTYAIPFPRSREAAKQWASDQANAKSQNHEFRWVIENLQGEFVGTLNTHGCDARVGTFWYGITLQREHWRKGYASEAIRLVLRYFFRELRYQKVTVDVYAFNTASLELHRQLGFQEEGRLRRMVYTDGHYHDTFILGMTVEEFEELEKRV